MGTGHGPRPLRSRRRGPLRHRAGRLGRRHGRQRLGVTANRRPRRVSIPCPSRRRCGSSCCCCCCCHHCCCCRRRRRCCCCRSSCSWGRPCAGRYSPSFVFYFHYHPSCCCIRKGCDWSRQARRLSSPYQCHQCFQRNNKQCQILHLSLPNRRRRKQFQILHLNLPTRRRRRRSRRLLRQIPGPRSGCCRGRPAAGAAGARRYGVEAVSAGRGRDAGAERGGGAASVGRANHCGTGGWRRQRAGGPCQCPRTRARAPSIYL